MHLDSGMIAYALDVNTGRVLQETQLVADIEPKGELAGAVLPDILVSDGANVYMRDMQFQPDDLSQHEITGKRVGYLRPNDGGLTERTWFNSAFWQYQAAAAQMIVFDAQAAYGIMAQNKLISKSYGQDIYTVGDGYRIFRVDLSRRLAQDADGQGSGKRRKAGARPGQQWETRVPVRAQSMVSTPRFLFLAGAPDIVDPSNPWGALEDRKGGLLQIYRKEDGEKMAEYTLQSTPIFDGMAAASGNLFVTLRDGSVVCLSGEE
jgi:hypothetical protein